MKKVENHDGEKPGHNSVSAKPDKTSIQTSMKKAAKSLWSSLPIIIGTILLISLITVLVPRSFYTQVFSNNMYLDPVVGSLVGSISAGNPIVSYILGGELLSQGLSMLAVVALLVAWVTVGIVQMPAEANMLGGRFAVLRNITAFFLAILVSVITVVILGIL